VVHQRPREQEDYFDVEDHEDQRVQVVADRKLNQRGTNGHHAALVWFEFDRVGFIRCEKPRENKRNNRENTRYEQKEPDWSKGTEHPNSSIAKPLPVMVARVSRGLPSVAEKPRFVAAMFGRIAARYDL